MRKQTRRAVRATQQATERAKRRKRFDRFIRLVEGGIRSRSALRMTGLDWRVDIGRWFTPVPLYAKRIREAQKAGHEWRRMELEDELWRRGVEGIEEPMVSCGKVVAVRIKRSDSALIALARKYLPHLFRDKVVVEIGAGRSIKDLIRELETGFTPKA